MKKILYVVSNLANQGPINVLYELVKNIDQDKFEISILTVKAENLKISRAKDFQDLGIEINSLNLTSRNFYTNGRAKFKKFIEDNKPDVVHSHNFKADYLASSITKKSDIITISTAHNFPYEDYVSQYGKLIGLIMAKRQINFHKKINHVICVSKTNLKKYNKYITNVSVIPNGVSIPDRKFDCGNETSFSVVGSISERKNTEQILKAFSIIKNRNFSLNIYGDGPLFDELSTKYSSDSIHFYGSIKDVQNQILKSKFFISASRSEGMPMAVLEAMSCNRLLILSDIEEHREITKCIDNDDSNFYELFKLDDVDNLASVIDGQLENNSGSTTSYEFAVSNFDSKLMTQRYEEIYLR